jgi:hypothetical protein
VPTRAPRRLGERLAGRDRHAKEYDLDAGRTNVIVNPDGVPLHFLAGGQWIDVSAFALSQVGDTIHSSSDDLPVSFSPRSVDYLIGRKHLSFRCMGLYADDTLLSAPADVTPVLEGDTVVYADVFDGVDLRYVVTPETVEQHVVFRKNPLLGLPIDATRLSVRFQESHGAKIDRANVLPVMVMDARGRRMAGLADQNGRVHEKSITVRALYSAQLPLDLDPTYTVAQGTAYTWECYEIAGTLNSSDLEAGSYGYYDSNSSSWYGSHFRSCCGFALTGYTGYTFTSAALQANKSSSGTVSATVHAYRIASIGGVYGDVSASHVTDFGTITAATTGTWLSFANSILTDVTALLGSTLNVVFIGDEGIDGGTGYDNYSPNVFTAQLSLVGSAGGSVIDITSAASDGYVECSPATTWANARAGTGSLFVAATITSTQMRASFTTSYAVYRSFFAFSLTGVSGTVSAATFTLTKFSTSTETGDLCLFQGSQADTLTTADFAAFGATELATRVASPTTTGGTAVFTLNAAGLAYLNSVGAGTAKFCVRIALDVDNTAPTTNLTNQFAASEHATPAYRPNLHVTFSGATTQALTGAASGAGALTTTLALLQAFTASGAGAGTETAALAQIVALTGSARGVASASATLAQVRALVASALAAGSEVAVLTQIAKIVASATGTGTEAAAVAQIATLAAAALGIGSGSASPTQRQALTALASGVGSEAATVAALVALAAQGSGVGALTATLKELQALAAASAGVGTASAVEGSFTVLGNAAANGSGSALATLLQHATIAAQATGYGTDTVTLAQMQGLAASLAGAATESAVLAPRTALMAALAGTGALTATPAQLEAMQSAAAGGNATAQATLTLTKQLVAQSAGIGSSSATMSGGLVPLTAAAIGDASAAAQLAELVSLAVAATGAGPVTAALAQMLAMSAAAAGDGTFTSLLTGMQDLGAAIAAGSGGMDAALQRLLPLAATATGNASMTAALTRLSLVRYLGRLSVPADTHVRMGQGAEPPHVRLEAAE